MFVKGQSAVESDSQYFHVGEYWNCGASYVDVGERRECECPLSVSKDDGVRRRHSNVDCFYLAQNYFNSQAKQSERIRI